MSEINVGQISEALNNKADRDLQNTQPVIGDYVVEYQAPTQNESRWYRKYKSGWVEQGGITDATTSATTSTFLITMADAYYAATASSMGGGKSFAITARTTTSISVQYSSIAGSSAGIASWEVKGFAAQS